MVGEGRKSVNGIDKPTRVKRQSSADRFLIASINVFHLWNLNFRASEKWHYFNVKLYHCHALLHCCYSTEVEKSTMHEKHEATNFAPAVITYQEFLILRHPNSEEVES